MADYVYSDDAPLVGVQRSRRCCSTNLICPLLFISACIALLVAALAGYFNDTYKKGFPLRVLSLNTWGMPARFGAEDKELRMEAIGKFVAKKEFDLYLFEELWMRPDHQTIMSHLPHGYHMTTYDSMTQAECPGDPITPFWCCDGAATPSGCSGLGVVSRYPLKEVQFTMFNDHGPMAGFEKLARKGFGRVRIEPKLTANTSLTIDVFLTHTCASDLDLDKVARENQVAQLMAAVRKSTADFVVLGGDFNSDPRAQNETTYSLLKDTMASSMEDFFKTVTAWLVPNRATYGNPRNTYSNSYDPVLYDYIWHRSSEGNLVVTNYFDVPFLNTPKAMFSEVEKSANNDSEKSGNNRVERSVGGNRVERSQGGSKLVSFSDHEGVTASLLLFKKK